VYDKHSSPCEKIQVRFRDDGSIVSFQRLPVGTSDDDEDVYKGRRQYSWHHTSKEFSRIITKVEKNGILEKFAVMQYKVPSDLSQLSLRAHGNSHKKIEPYFRTKPSVIQKAKSATQSNEKPKRIISIIEQEAGGVLNASSPSDII